MKCRFLILLLLSLPLLGYADLIGVGYYNKYAKIWRFYERNNKGEFEPKVLVYNTTGQPIIFYMKVTLSNRALDSKAMVLLKQFTGLSSDTVVRPVTIPAYGYGIYTTEQELTNRSTGFFDAVYINGECAGIEFIRLKPQITDSKYKYYSYEALGSPHCLIGTNDLIAPKGKTCKMTLFYSNIEKERTQLPMKEWRFDATLKSGNIHLTIHLSGNKKIKIDPAHSKTTFSIDVSQIDIFNIEITYKILNRDSLPAIDLYKYFGSNGSSNGMELPIFLQRL